MIFFGTTMTFLMLLPSVHLAASGVATTIFSISAGLKVIGSSRSKRFFPLMETGYMKLFSTT